ncbi:hypothetical protein VCHA43P273_330032 [Vibrio chagasii]|nr:hypothetical protein VCHA43P273_330032 [Vibrio chagasii]
MRWVASIVHKVTPLWTLHQITSNQRIIQIGQIVRFVYNEQKGEYYAITYC